MSKFVTVIFVLISGFTLAQTVTIDGIVKLADTENHGGIEVEFSRIAPTPLIQVFTTNSTGNFSGSLPVGIYDITYRKAEYFSFFVENVNCFTTPTLVDQLLHPRGTRIHVPEVFQLIQHAIDNSNNGDTIILQSGVYYENINLKGKKITIASMFIFSQDTSHIGSTIIDGKGEKSVVVCSSGENSETVITGLTIRNGRATGGYPDYFGGGIRCEWSSPTLTYLIIENNHSDLGGGGIHFHNSSSQVAFVKILGNSTDNDGGGVRITSSLVKLENVIIANNSAYNRGGGIACTYFNYVGEAEIVNSTIVNNTVVRVSDPNDIFNGGAGIKAYGHNLRIENSIVANNKGDYGVSYYHYLGSDQYPFISHSLLWENQTGNFYECDPLCGPTVTTNINGTNVDAFFNVFNNPHFKERDDNFTLLFGSAAVDAGYNEFASFSKDIFLAQRIQNNNSLVEARINIGATESLAGVKPVVTYDVEHCAPEPLDISIASQGTQFKWFTTPSLEDYLGESSNHFVIDTLTRSTVLYVGNSDQLVMSELTPVVINIYQTPDFQLESIPVNSVTYQFFASEAENIDHYLWTITDSPLNSEMEYPVFEFTETGTYEICLTASNPGCEVHLCDQFTLVITSLTEDIENEFVFFPNPVHDQLSIKTNRKDDFAFEILDSSGRIVHASQGSSSYEVEFNNFVEGIYFLLIKPSYLNKDTKIYKIVKSAN